MREHLRLRRQKLADLGETAVERLFVRFSNRSLEIKPVELLDRESDFPEKLLEIEAQLETIQVGALEPRIKTGSRHHLHLHEAVDHSLVEMPLDLDFAHVLEAAKKRRIAEIL